MQPTNPIFSDLYPHHQTAQYYSHFPPQNPNPYPLHQQLQIESHTVPDPPGVDPYYQSYPISHAGGAYTAHHARDLTYSTAIGASLPSNYTPAQAWPVEEPVQQYGNTLYTVGATIPQDVQQQLLPMIPTQSTWTNPVPMVQPRRPWKKIQKKTKIVQSAWCEICKIECNTRDVLDIHKAGRKHIKNVEKLKAAASVAAASAAAASAAAASAAAVATASTTESKPVIIGPMENPKKGNSGTKKKAQTPEELEMKRRKVLEGGAAATAVRTCAICNVVCNSDAVFKFHLAGQKHASMSKKSQLAGAV